ncbi:MAG: alpha/beta hydrolase [Fibrobacteraceae bacterium]|nr:alpha/beta hydrolase [Fibrobacteraceae bacterium]
MKIKEHALHLLFKALRFAGILLVIYISMIFYLALTERRNAFPRAISHNEARAAIKNSAHQTSCTLEDGTVLEGWTIGKKEDPVFLYFPDADEDGAQFIAETQGIPGVLLATFNYRGSGANKGTPSEDNFETDAQQIVQCATQINGNEPQFLAGRGTGAILASNQLQTKQFLYLIDPATSIAGVIAEKYRILYPRFLVRTKTAMNLQALKTMQSHIFIVSDRIRYCDRAHTAAGFLPKATVLKRSEMTLQEFFSNNLQKTKNSVSP